MSSCVRYRLDSTRTRVVASLLTGVTILATAAFLLGIKPNVNQHQQEYSPRVRVSAESAYVPEVSGYSVTGYENNGYEADAFDAPSELALGRLLNALISSPSKALTLLQNISLQPEFAQLLGASASQQLLIEQDLFALTEDPSFDQLIATAPVKDLWMLQRELEALTDPQLKQETAAQLMDIFHRVYVLRAHPIVAEMLADAEFRQYLQTADLVSLSRDARVLELAAMMLTQG